MTWVGVDKEFSIFELGGIPLVTKSSSPQRHGDTEKGEEFEQG